LHRGGAEAARAEDGDGFTRLQTGLFERVQGCGGGAHHHGAMFEGNFGREFENAARGHHDEFGVTTIAVFADHLGGLAKLLRAAIAEIAMAAGGEIVRQTRSPGLRSRTWEPALSTTPLTSWPRVIGTGFTAEIPAR